MPTHRELPRFLREWGRLREAQREDFLEALALFISGLRTRNFHPRLRIKRVEGYPDIWEMTWAPDGRATFQYGQGPVPGDPHIIWRRIGTHDIFREP